MGGEEKKVGGEEEGWVTRKRGWTMVPRGKVERKDKGAEMARCPSAMAVVSRTCMERMRPRMYHVV